MLFLPAELPHESSTLLVDLELEVVGSGGVDPQQVLHLLEMGPLIKVVSRLPSRRSTWKGVLGEVELEAEKRLSVLHYRTSLELVSLEVVGGDIPNWEEAGL